MRQRWRAMLWRVSAALIALSTGGAGQGVGIAAAAVSTAEQEAWNAARSSGSAASFQRYLELYPTGQYAEEAFRILIEKSWRPPDRDTPAGADVLDVDRGQVIVAAQSLY
jgi:hypothetical protein